MPVIISTVDIHALDIDGNRGSKVHWVQEVQGLALCQTAERIIINQLE